jgi:hypothetical protein
MMSLKRVAPLFETASTIKVIPVLFSRLSTPCDGVDGRTLAVAVHDVQGSAQHLTDRTFFILLTVFQRHNIVFRCCIATKFVIICQLL